MSSQRLPWSQYLTTSSWCEFTTPTIKSLSHHLTTSSWCEFTTPTMKVKKTVPSSKNWRRWCIRKESSSKQTDRVVAESQSCSSVPGWSQCSVFFIIITNPICIYFERISIEFVYRPAFLLWKNTCCETCAVGDPRKLTAIRTKSEDLPLQL